MWCVPWRNYLTLLMCLPLIDVISSSFTFPFSFVMFTRKIWATAYPKHVKLPKQIQCVSMIIEHRHATDYIHLWIVIVLHWNPPLASFIYAKRPTRKRTNIPELKWKLCMKIGVENWCWLLSYSTFHPFVNNKSAFPYYFFLDFRRVIWARRLHSPLSTK